VNKLYESMPDFASEKEEAEWWDAHAEERDGEFAEAAANGTLMNREQFRAMMLHKHGVIWPEARLSIFLSNEDLAKTNAIAASEGLDAEAYVGKMLHELLESKQAA
jgi:hypothetical protein